MSPQYLHSSTITVRVAWETYRVAVYYWPNRLHEYTFVTGVKRMPSVKKETEGKTENQEERLVLKRHKYGIKGGGHTVDRTKRKPDIQYHSGDPR